MDIAGGTGQFLESGEILMGLMFTVDSHCTKLKPWLGDIGRNFKIVLRQPSLRSFGRGIRVERVESAYTISAWQHQ